MTKKTILIPGGSSGIGKATALKLAQLNDDLIIVGRNAQKGKQARQEIAQKTGANVTFMTVDMSLMSNVQQFAEEFLISFQKIDYLVHCAGVIMPEPIITKEGLELVFATQFLSRYHLTSLLMPALADGGKVLFVTSGNTTDGTIDYNILNKEETFGMFRTITSTSQALSLYTLMLMTDYPTLGVYNYGPGVVNTEISRNITGIRGMLSAIFSRFIAVSPEQVGQEIAMLLTQSNDSGWYKKGLEKQPNPAKPFAEERKKLKQFSENLLST
ncbi:MAG: SDR family NAD(P)-dependent oxidoreductase [Chloroflexota bacterium]